MFADIGYGLSAVGYLGLLFLLVVSGIKGGYAKLLLLLTSVSTFVWSILHLSMLDLVNNASFVLLLDAVKLWVFVLFSLSCLKHADSSLWRFLIRPLPLTFIGFASLSLLLNLFTFVPQLWLFAILMLIALSILILMEMLYRQAGAQRWEFKVLVIYMGSLALFDFVTYANASMVAQLGATYIDARGYIYFAMIPFMVLAIRRISNWGVNIYVSRDVVLHSSLLMVAGGYLFFMAAIGYAVKYFGGNWSYSLQMVLVAVSVILLLTVFISEQFRRKLKVFIAKHFYANQFDYRIEWVKLTQTLAAPQHSQSLVYQSTLDAFLNTINYKSGSLYQVDKTSLRLLASSQDEAPLLKLTKNERISLNEFLNAKQWIIDSNELDLRPDLYTELRLEPSSLTYLNNYFLLPLFDQDTLWGIVAMTTDANEVKTLNWELRDYLNAVTGQISNYLFHYQSAQALAENAQFAAFNRMSAFVLHDLKNVMAQVDMILSNSQQHKHNPEFIEDTFETLEYTKIRIAKMLGQLTDKNSPEYNARKNVDLVAMLTALIEQKCQSYKPLPVVNVTEEIFIDIDPEKLSNVLYHLISNAQQATQDNGSVNIDVALNPVNQEQRAEVLITIADSGEGMSASFIETRLFKPFDTTKGNAGMGIGAYDAKHFVEENNGSITVESKEGSGTTFTVALPIKQ